RCIPQDIDLSLSPERALRFRLRFSDGSCKNLTVEAGAPDKPLPWTFDSHGAHLELKSSRGPIVTGALTLPSGGEISFTVWSEGNGAYPISLAGKTILLTGDSMSEGIGWTMREKVEAAGGRLIVQPWYSSTTVGWQSEGRMRQYIDEYKPDIVFVALGSNEIFTGDMEARARAVRDITAEIGDRPAYWIGPPSWKPDHGIVHTIEENFRPYCFYNSNDLRVPRRKDGAHPTPEGFATWTDLIWNWYARTM
ncbi:MAG TPA: SGNH/GDSL hydrolase family protein, partial [Pyrinomonadaceae bacterium]|nr:SGNH/GDSL hydrolase family protein [Pyrinomonadaceae bacterium]